MKTSASQSIHASAETRPGQTLPGVVVNSGEIMRGQQELQINHAGSIYTLRITRQGKLILTK